MIVESVGEWLLVTPNDPYLASYERTPREPLETYLKATVKIRRRTLFDYSKLAAETARPSVAAQYLSRLLGVPPEGVYGFSRLWNTVKLYGLLTSTQRTALEQGVAIKYSNLDKNQQGRFLRLAVSRLVDSLEPIPGTDSFKITGQSYEPTEWLSDRVLAGAELTMDVRDDLVVFGYRKVGDEYKVISTFSPRYIALFEHARRNPGTAPPTDVFPDAWAMGARRTIHFKLQFTEKDWQLFTLAEEATDPDAKLGPWDKLPQDIVDAIRKRLEGYIPSLDPQSFPKDRGRPTRLVRS